MVDPVSRSAALIAAAVAVPLAALAGFGVFVLLGSAGDTADEPADGAPVDIPVRALDERAEVVCRAVLSQVPAEITELPQRPVTAGAEQNAAYGDPAVKLECGVDPVEYDPTDQVWPLSGVCWYAAEEPDRTVWTTLDREVPVRVTVPAGYDGPGQQVAALSPAIAETVRSADDVPSGCR